VTAASRGRAIALAVAALLTTATPALAQRVARRVPRPEVRVDYLGPDPHTAHAGVGLNVPVGTYLRVAIIGGGGTSWRGERVAASARADVVGRFAFDPFRERRWGLSAGGGLSVRYDDRVPAGRPRWRALLALVVDLEGPRIGTLAPALQVGLGGGLRAGAILRSSHPNRR
jgi:hypothetical protein